MVAHFHLIYHNYRNNRKERKKILIYIYKLQHSHHMNNMEQGNFEHLKIVNVEFLDRLAAARTKDAAVALELAAGECGSRT
jgi:hypothetical protein